MLRINDFEDYLSNISNRELRKELDIARSSTNSDWFAVLREMKHRGLLKKFTKSEVEDVNNNDWEMREEMERFEREARHYESQSYQLASGDY